VEIAYKSPMPHFDRSKDVQVGFLQAAGLKLSQTGKGTCTKKSLIEYPNSPSRANAASTVKFSLVNFEKDAVRDIDIKWGRRDLF
jgi:hypothetical protein